MPFTLDQVHELATSLPDVTVGPKWGTRTWMVGGKGFAWERPLRKADLERLGDEPAPTGDILGVRTENLDAKDMLLAMELPGFFTIQHFNGYPAVLIALRKARAKDVRVAIEAAYQAMMAKRPKRRAATAATAKKKPTKKPARRRSR